MKDLLSLLKNEYYFFAQPGVVQGNFYLLQNKKIAQLLSKFSRSSTHHEKTTVVLSRIYSCDYVLLLLFL